MLWGVVWILRDEASNQIEVNIALRDAASSRVKTNTILRDEAFSLVKKPNKITKLEAPSGRPGSPLQ